MEIDLKDTDLTASQKKICIKCLLIRDFLTSPITYILILEISAIIPFVFIHNNVVLLTSVMWGLACITLGSFIGFLFAIPKRTNQQNDNNDMKDSDVMLWPNTNLQEVSDWLTKIIVGIGLVQFNNIANYVYLLAEKIGYSVQSIDKVDKYDYTMYVMGLIVFYFISGFLIGYLGTRLKISPELSKADSATIGKLNKKVNDLEKRVREHENISNMITIAERNITVNGLINDFHNKTKEALDKERKDKLDTAKAILEEVIKCDPGNIPATIGLSKCYTSKTPPEYDNAISTVTDAIEKIKNETPTNIALHRLYYNRACYKYRKTKNLKDAEEDLKKAVNLKRDFYKNITKLDSDWKNEYGTELFNRILNPH